MKYRKEYENRSNNKLNHISNDQNYLSMHNSTANEWIISTNFPNIWQHIFLHRSEKRYEQRKTTTNN